jgi:transposase
MAPIDREHLLIQRWKSSVLMRNFCALRLIRRIVNEVLVALDSEFTKVYADSGRPSIPPERLLRALLLQAFYTIRSETQLMEQLHWRHVLWHFTRAASGCGCRGFRRRMRLAAAS